MASRTILALALALSSVGTAIVSDAVTANTPLSRATIQKLRNKVELSLKAQPVRPAKQLDTMAPGDALRTFRSAMAELRFNDNSLARVGEQAQFVFIPNSRNFQLNRGTVLLLIPPGQGRTRVSTPNAAAGIRGSALFVRYIEDSNVTMVGALTNSDIEISTVTGQTVVLKAGQIGYVYKDQIGVYNFDQKTFQETSPFFKDLDWNTISPEVKQEIAQALKEQESFTGKFAETPTWTKLSDNRSPSVMLPLEPVASTTSYLDKPDSQIYKGPATSPNASTTQPNTIPQQPTSPAQPVIVSTPPTAPPAPLPVRPDPVVTTAAPQAVPPQQAPAAPLPPTAPTPTAIVPPVRPVPAPVVPSTPSTPPAAPAAPPAVSLPPVVTAAPVVPSTPSTPPTAPAAPPAAPLPPVAAPSPVVTPVAPPPATPPLTPPVVTPAPVLSSPSIAVPAAPAATANVPPIAPAAAPPSVQLPPAPVVTTPQTTPAPAAASPPTAGAGGVQTPADNLVGGSRPLPVVTP